MRVPRKVKKRMRRDGWSVGFTAAGRYYFYRVGRKFKVGRNWYLP